MRVMWDLDCRGEGRRGGFGAVRCGAGNAVVLYIFLQDSWAENG